MIFDDRLALQLSQQRHSWFPAKRMVVDQNIINMLEKLADPSQRPNSWFFKIGTPRVESRLASVILEHPLHRYDVIADSVPGGQMRSYDCKAGHWKCGKELRCLGLPAYGREVAGSE